MGPLLLFQSLPQGSVFGDSAGAGLWLRHVGLD